MLVRRSGISGARGGMLSELEGLLQIVSLEVMRESVRASTHYNNNNNDRLTAFDPGQPG